MAKSGRQTSNELLEEINRKASFTKNINSKAGTGTGNPVISGTMVGGNMVLHLQDGSNIQINGVETLDSFDHFVSGSASVPVSETEALDDWNNV